MPYTCCGVIPYSSDFTDTKPLLRPKTRTSCCHSNYTSGSTNTKNSKPHHIALGCMSYPINCASNNRRNNKPNKLSILVGVCQRIIHTIAIPVSAVLIYIRFRLMVASADAIYKTAQCISWQITSHSHREFQV